MEITNPQEVQNNDQLPPQLQDAAVDQSVRPYKGNGGGAPLGYIPKPRRTQVPVRMTDEYKIILDEHIRKRKIGNCDYSLNKFMLEAIEEKIARDNAVPENMT